MILFKKRKKKKLAKETLKIWVKIHNRKSYMENKDINCAFCRDAFERQKYNYAFRCESCLLEPFICNNLKCSVTLVSLLNKYCSEVWEENKRKARDKINYLINLIKECLREIEDEGKVFKITRLKVSSIMSFDLK